MKEFFKKMLSSDPDVSSKRFMGLTAAAVIYIIALVDLFSNFTVTEYVFDGLVWLAIAGIVGIASENLVNMIGKGKKIFDQAQQKEEDNKKDEANEQN
jgi:positive regulator of sigma E activity